MPPVAAMSTVPRIIIGEDAEASASDSDFAENWREMRENEDIQFSPVDVPEEPPREPSWFERLLQDFFEFLGDSLSWFPSAWPVLKWVLIALAAALALFILYRLLEPYLQSRNQDHAITEVAMEWAPDAAQSAALLEDADRLASEGKYDEATHLLLQRSVSHMAAAKPDWVEPSSTARELTAIEALPDKARETFRVIAERVEQSLFALRSLNKDDWEAARAAYADFAATSLRGAVV